MLDRADILSGRIEQYTGMNASVKQQMRDAHTVQGKIDLLMLAIHQSNNMKTAFENDGFKSLPTHDENRTSFIAIYKDCKKNLKKLRKNLGEDLLTLQQEINKKFDTLNIINEFSPELHIDEYAVEDELAALNTQNRTQGLVFIELKNYLILIASLKELDQLISSKNLKAKINDVIALEDDIHAHLNHGVDIGQMVLDYQDAQTFFADTFKHEFENIENTLQENTNKLSNLAAGNTPVKKNHIDATTAKSERLLKNKKEDAEKILSYHEKNKIAVKNLENDFKHLNQSIDDLAEKMSVVMQEKDFSFPTSNEIGERFNLLHDATDKQLDECEAAAQQNEENIAACHQNLSFVDGFISTRNRDRNIENLHGIDGEKFAEIKQFVMESAYFKKIVNHRQHTKGRKKDDIQAFLDEVRYSQNLNELMILISPAYRQEHGAENTFLSHHDMTIKNLDKNLRRTTSTLKLYSLFTSHKSTTDKYMKHLQADVETWLDTTHGLKITSQPGRSVKPV